MSVIFYKELFTDHWNNRKNKRQRPLQASFFKEVHELQCMLP